VTDVDEVVALVRDDRAGDAQDGRAAGRDPAISEGTDRGGWRATPRFALRIAC
jgi:hypothetical protein